MTAIRDISGGSAAPMYLDSVRKGTAVASQVTASTSASVLLAANANRVSAIFYNNGSVTVYIGGSGVTSSNGFPIPAGQSFTDDASNGVWYVVSASSTASIGVIEVS